MAKYKQTSGGKYVHRVVWEEHHGKIPDGMEIDHINNSKHDNRIENLQLLTVKQNRQRNYKGKGYIKYHNRYRASKTFNNASYYLGMFGTPCGAKMAYNTFFIGEKYDTV